MTSFRESLNDPDFAERLAKCIRHNYDQALENGWDMSIGLNPEDRGEPKLIISVQHQSEND
jgi:hypothetical protein